MSNILHNENIDLNPTHDAFPYQKEAFDSIKDIDYAAIFHEQGLGKTKIAIDLLIYWLEAKDIDTVFIVTKKQLVYNWEKEFSFHTHIKPKTLSNDRANNFFALNSNSRVFITNFESISGEKERLKLYLKTRNVGIIIDESTKIKNPESKLTQSFFELAPLFKKRVIMTGTPVANRPYDLWAQIYFLDGGKSLGNDFNDFMQKTNLSNDLVSNDLKRTEFEDTVSTIFDKIRDFSVRETKNSGVITLPDKRYYSVMCDFEPIQFNMYNAIKTELQIFIQKNDEAVLDDNEDTLKRLLRLNQVTSNPRLIDELYGSLSAKEAQLIILLGTIDDRGEKAIVWTSFIENVDYFCERFKKYNPAKIHGNLPISIRNKNVDKFLSDETCKVLFATPQSAKEGLTLTVANNVIFYDRGFNLDDYLQAQDRIHRISQTKECNIYNIMVNDSIDIWIDALLKAKQNAAHLAQGDYKLAKFTKEMDYSYGDMIKDILN